MGAYVDISMYIKTGDSGWNAITETGEPIEAVTGIPEELRSEGREYYVPHSAACAALSGW